MNWINGNVTSGAFDRSASGAQKMRSVAQDVESDTPEQANTLDTPGSVDSLLSTSELPSASDTKALLYQILTLLKSLLSLTNPATFDNSINDAEQSGQVAGRNKSRCGSRSQSDDSSDVDDSGDSRSSHRRGRAHHTGRQNADYTPENPAVEDNTPVTGEMGTPVNANGALPAINPNEWSTRDGANGGDFATPFASGNVIKNGNSITTQVQGGEGGEALLNKDIGTGFYQFDVNPQLSSQVGDIPTVFFYTGKGSDGGDYEGGFELDAEYNMVEQGTVTFGTWIDGKKYNEVTVPAPQGDQTIGFNIQNGISQIGFVTADGRFDPVSETNDERITPELASNLKAMTNSWRSKSSGSDGSEKSSITVNGFGRSAAPGQPATAV